MCIRDRECELKNCTVIQGSPDSNQAQVYLDLAKKIMENENFVIPTPLDDRSFDIMIKQPLMVHE